MTHLARKRYGIQPFTYRPTSKLGLFVLGLVLLTLAAILAFVAGTSPDDALLIAGALATAFLLGWTLGWIRRGHRERSGLRANEPEMR